MKGVAMAAMDGHFVRTDFEKGLTVKNADEIIRILLGGSRGGRISGTFGLGAIDEDKSNENGFVAAEEMKEKDLAQQVPLGQGGNPWQ